MNRFLFWTALAMLPAPALSSGFTAEEMAKAARETPQDEQIKAARTLFAETETLRAAFVINPTRTLAALSDTEREVLLRAAEPSTERRMLALHWFMRGGISKASIIDGAMLSGIYHPVAQVWMLIRWDRRNEGWRVVDAAFVAAKTLGDGSEIEPTSIVDSYRQATTDFTRITQELSIPTIFASRIGDRSAAQGASFDRIETAVATLGRLYGEAPQAKALTRFKATLERTEGEGMSAVLTLPSQARKSLAPVAAMRTARGVTVWLSSPLAPATLITADWQNGDFGMRPEVRAVALDRLVDARATKGVGQ